MELTLPPGRLTESQIKAIACRLRLDALIRLDLPNRELPAAYLKEVLNVKIGIDSSNGSVQKTADGQIYVSLNNSINGYFQNLCLARCLGAIVLLCPTEAGAEWNWRYTYGMDSSQEYPNMLGRCFLAPTFLVHKYYARMGRSAIARYFAVSDHMINQQRRI